MKEAGLAITDFKNFWFYKGDCVLGFNNFYMIDWSGNVPAISHWAVTSIGQLFFQKETTKD